MKRRRKTTRKEEEQKKKWSMLTRRSISLLILCMCFEHFGKCQYKKKNDDGKKEDRKNSKEDFKEERKLQNKESISMNYGEKNEVKKLIRILKYRRDAEKKNKNEYFVFMRRKIMKPWLTTKTKRKEKRIKLFFFKKQPLSKKKSF